MQINKNKIKYFTTEDINFFINKFYAGYPITRSEQFLYRNIPGTKDSNVTIVLTDHEKLEYAKCYNDIEYFIEKYCEIQLRDFQKEWIKHFENRFPIYCISRQTGYTKIIAAIYLHYLIFNSNKNIILLAHKNDSSLELLDRVYNLYLTIPYFLKPGLLLKNSYQFKFDNGNRIKIIKNYKNLDNIKGYDIDILSISDFSNMWHECQKEYLSQFIPLVAARKNTKLIIDSKPSGHNLFYKLVIDSERKEKDPLKNQFKTIKTYWWEVEERDHIWKENTIKDLGSEEIFNQEFDLQFYSKNII